MSDQRIGTILWRGKWLVVAAVAVGIVLAVLETKTSAKVYQASSTIQVNSGAAGGASTINPADVQLANQNLAATYATLLTDRGFLTKVQPTVEGGALSVGDLQSRLSAHAVTGTSLITLDAQGPSPDAARELAGAVTTAFLQDVQAEASSSTSTLQAQIQQQISRLTTQINRLRRRGGNADELASLTGARAELVRQLAAITANEIASGNSLQAIAPPTGSNTPVKPRPMLNLVAGLLLGLLVGIALAYLRARLDRGLHSGDEAEELLGVPALATIPVRRTYSSHDPVLGEAFDLLRANLAFLSHDHELRVLTLTSANPREGKSSTVEGLAQAAVRGGMSVLMVDGDVRTRALSTRLGYGDAPGLTTAIVGMGDAGDAVVELAPGMALLPAGPTPPNPPSLLSSASMSDLVERLRERYSLVIVDAPPVTDLADASILASMSDGIILVARVGVAKRTDLPAMTAALRQVPTPVLGVVVLDQKQVDETYYPAVSSGVTLSAPREDAQAKEPLESF